MTEIQMGYQFDSKIHPLGDFYAFVIESERKLLSAFAITDEKNIIDLSADGFVEYFNFDTIEDFIEQIYDGKATLIRAYDSPIDYNITFQG